MCDRAQGGLEAILTPAIRLSAGAHAVFASDATEEEKQAAGPAYGAAERVIHHAMNQLYFGSGAHADDRDGGPGLTHKEAKARFLTDYADISSGCCSSPASRPHCTICSSCTSS